MEKKIRKEEALAVYEKALEIKPDYSVAWHNKGISLDNLGRKEEALDAGKKAKKTITSSSLSSAPLF